jgi:hypothetical protein
MTRKAKVLRFILGNPKATYKDWEKFQHDEPSLRLKRVGTTGVLINLSKSDGWIDPQSWGNNYLAGLRLHVEQALVEFSEAGGTVTELPEVSKAFAELHKENEELAAKLESCRSKLHAMNQVYAWLILELQRIQLAHEADEQNRYLSGKETYTRLVTQLNPNKSFEENEEKLRNFKLS